jgi:hypothetical protein
MKRLSQAAVGLHIRHPESLHLLIRKISSGSLTSATGFRGESDNQCPNTRTAGWLGLLTVVSSGRYSYFLLFNWSNPTAFGYLHS